MSEGEPPSKRARQACDLCRRKKTRCPGERPKCSYCLRLGQPCTYGGPTARIASPYNSNNNHSTAYSTNGDGSAANTPLQTPVRQSDVPDRLRSLETQLANVLATLHNQNSRQLPSNDQTPSPLYRELARQSSPSFAGPSSSTTLPSWQLIQDVAQLYLKYCHSQPLPLFEPATFIATLRDREHEIIFSVLALAIRFSQDYKEPSRRDEAVARYSESARSMVMHRIISGTIELSTLQSLCILCLVDYHHGNTQRASIHSTLAMELCQSSGLSASTNGIPESQLQDEQIRCFWSIVILKRLHGNISGAFTLTVDEKLIPNYPQSSPRPPSDHEPVTATGAMRLGTDYPDLGIVAYVIQLTEVWQKAARYAHRRMSSEVHPPWSPESENVQILARQMERETLMPFSKHRFKPARFGERSPLELARHRDYWGPWLLNQMMYHTIICLLNHPLLLSLRLRNFKVASVPEIWLQHTDDLVSSHTHWVIHLIELCELKFFEVSDPFLAHCAAIVATIYLQQSFVQDVGVQVTKKASYSRCLQFCQKIGTLWPSASDLAQKLQQFEKVVSTSFQDSAAAHSYDKVYIDLTIFWDILESSIIKEEIDKSGIRFGQSLASNHKHSGTAEELSTRLLPEPSRLDSPNVLNQASPHESRARSTGGGMHPLSFNPPATISDDFSVLAQSYFAQGQDFVGSLDDWWALG